jgi:hypothetical protein
MHEDFHHVWQRKGRCAERAETAQQELQWLHLNI